MMQTDIYIYLFLQMLRTEVKSGSVVMFTYESEEKEWNFLTLIHASDGSSSDKFGASVAMHGSTIVVGTELADGFDYNSGAVYAYTTVPDYVYYVDDSLTATGVTLLTGGALIFSASIVLWAYKSGKMNTLLEKDCYFGAMGHNPDFDSSRRGDVSLALYLLACLSVCLALCLSVL